MHKTCSMMASILGAMVLKWVVTLPPISEKQPSKQAQVLTNSLPPSCLMQVLELLHKMKEKHGLYLIL